MHGIKKFTNPSPTSAIALMLFPKDHKIPGFFIKFKVMKLNQVVQFHMSNKYSTYSLRRVCFIYKKKNVFFVLKYSFKNVLIILLRWECIKFFENEKLIIFFKMWKFNEVVDDAIRRHLILYKYRLKNIVNVTCKSIYVFLCNILRNLKLPRACRLIFLGTKHVCIYLILCAFFVSSGLYYEMRRAEVWI